MQSLCSAPVLSFFASSPGFSVGFSPKEVSGVPFRAAPGCSLLLQLHSFRGKCVLVIVNDHDNRILSVTYWSYCEQQNRVVWFNTYSFIFLYIYPFKDGWQSSSACYAKPALTEHLSHEVCTAKGGSTPTQTPWANINGMVSLIGLPKKHKHTQASFNLSCLESMFFQTASQATESRGSEILFWKLVFVKSLRPLSALSFSETLGTYPGLLAGTQGVCFGIGLSGGISSVPAHTSWLLRFATFTMTPCGCFSAWASFGRSRSKAEIKYSHISSTSSSPLLPSSMIEYTSWGQCKTSLDGWWRIHENSFLSFKLLCSYILCQKCSTKKELTTFWFGSLGCLVTKISFFDCNLKQNPETQTHAHTHTTQQWHIWGVYWALLRGCQKNS